VSCGGRWSDVVVWIYSRQVLLSTVVMVWWWMSGLGWDDGINIQLWM
jgi:hypothetical protein